MLKKINDFTSDLPFKTESFELSLERSNLGINIAKIRKYRGINLDSNFEKKYGISNSDFELLEYSEVEVDIETLYRISTILKVDLKLFFNNDINWDVVEIIDYYFKKTEEKELDFIKIIYLIYLIDYEYFQLKNESFSWNKFYINYDGLFNENFFELKKFFKVVEGNFYNISRSISIKNNISLEDKEKRSFLDKMFKKYSCFNGEELKKLAFKTKPLLKYNNKDEINKNIGIEVKF